MSITELLGIPLGFLLSLCYNLVQNYGVAIVIFTLLTKIILLPVAMWTQKNSIVMVKIMPQLNNLKIKYFGDKETIAEKTQELYKEEHYHPIGSSIPMIIQIVLLLGVIDAVKQMLGDSDSILNLIPYQEGGITLLMPIAAGLAALALTLAQNKIGPLQKEQTKSEQFVTGAISVSISLFLGAFVSLGTGVYWISSNLLSIPMQVLLNILVNPKKYVDYEALENSRKELNMMSSLDNTISKEDKKREKVDYKRFFSVANKHLVFYSETSGYYKYYKGVVEYILAHSNVIIHYVTNDPHDQIFEIAKTQPRIKPYYIGPKKIITLMMKMDADIVVMTTPDLEKYHIKRSYVRKDIEYIHFFHAMVSSHMVDLKGAYDHFDTIMCAGQHQINELRESEELYGVPIKTLVPYGYSMLDDMITSYAQMTKVEKERKDILIAPSWHDGNILESCIDDLISQLYSEKYKIVVRPHPEYIKRYKGKMDALLDKYKNYNAENLIFETDFSSNVTIYTADLVITDWSGISLEFAFTTKKPVLLINTPMKVNNPEYIRYKNVPIEITIRDKIGVDLDLDELNQTRDTVEQLIANQAQWAEKITAVLDETVFNIGNSAAVGARYILNQLANKKKEDSNN